VTAPGTAVVVSGASSGIGEAAAVLLARRGYIAYAGVRTGADAERLAATHPNVRPVTLDVTDERSVASAFQTIDAGGVPLHAAVCNAGIAVGGPLEHVALQRLKRQFDVNVFGAMRVAQAALARFSGRWQRIVLVGSISGRLTVPYIGPYSASKAALRALADALRFELAPAGIAVSLIEAGSVTTPIWSKGRASRDEIEREIAGTQRTHYLAAAGRALEQTNAEERAGMPVERVAEAIAHAVTARRPRASYLLGGPARAGSILALMPQAWRDRALRASLHLP
jgi:NAD(P)-dependent dehydrogenase (short-subunit alcohol dehydrogenase family)